MQLYDRRYKLTIGTFDVSALDISFEVKKSIKSEPNTCEIQVYNLTEEHRKALENPKDKKLTARLDAGYVNGTAQIYLGEVRTAHSVFDGSDIVTEISSGDGEKEVATKRINVPIGPGTPPDRALEQIVSALGLGKGNLEKAKALVNKNGTGTLYGKGTILSGNASQILDDYCRSANLEWSIQDGNIQILSLNKALEGKAILLDSSHGLVGSPTVDSKGFLQATTLMIPELRPGVLVDVQSVGVKGGYRITDAHYKGNTKGKEWYVEIHAKRY